MKIGICGGGNVTITMDTSLSFIGVDKGIETLLKQDIVPIIGVGDFDSITDTGLLKTLEIQTLPTRKDITDSEYALQYAITEGYTDIYMYGVTGGRMDHYMAIVCLLQKYADVHIEVLDAQNRIRILQPGTHKIVASSYKYFSVFSFAESKISITSCEYPLSNYVLKKEDPLCVSNQVVNDYSEITTDTILLCIESKDLR